MARGGHGCIGVAATLKGVAVLEIGVGDGLGWGGWGVALFSIHGMSYGVAEVAGVASLVGPWNRERSNSNLNLKNSKVT